MNKKQYSIGEMSKICRISKKALRFYDTIGLISSLRKDYNNYRFYTHDEMLMVLVLKYYKQMGFKLEEMKDFIAGQSDNVYSAMLTAFDQKIKELQQTQIELRRCEDTTHDWRELLQEAEQVIAEDIRDVSFKYIEPKDFVYQEQLFDGDIKSAILNIDFMDYIENTGNAISGPVYIKFSNVDDRIARRPQNMVIMQHTLVPDSEGERIRFGGFMMASCYHIGALENIPDTYSVFINQIRQHGYTPEKECYERYVTDYWTTRNSNYHVAELMVKVSRHPRKS